MPAGRVLVVKHDTHVLGSDSIDKWHGVRRGGSKYPSGVYFRQGMPMTLNATRTRLHPRMPWRWMLSVLLAALVMVGLLSMHTLMTGHSEAPSGGVSSIEAEHGHGSSPNAGALSESACESCTSGGMHDALSVVCVIGLLAAALWAARSGPGVIRRRRSARTVLARLVAVPTSAMTRPPSLLDLSISRT